MEGWLALLSWGFILLVCGTLVACVVWIARSSSTDRKNPTSSPESKTSRTG